MHRELFHSLIKSLENKKEKEEDFLYLLLKRESEKVLKILLVIKGVRGMFIKEFEVFPFNVNLYSGPKE